MANGMYTPTKEALVGGDFDWDTADVRVLLVTSGYTVNLATHDFLNDVPGGAVRVATSGALAGKTKAGGVIDANDITLTAVPAATVNALVIHDQNGGADSARRLFFYIDTATGLPLTTNGGDVTITWDSGVNRIAKIG